MSKPTYDPFAVINLVIGELARQKVKSRFTGAQLSAAATASEHLLTVLGVTPCTSADDKPPVPDRKEAPNPS